MFGPRDYLLCKQCVAEQLLHVASQTAIEEINITFYLTVECTQSLFSISKYCNITHVFLYMA